MSAQLQTRLSPEQYLQLERLSEVRNEFYNGRMYAMSGGTYNHSRVIANLTTALSNSLREKPCEVSSSELRVRISPDGLYTYPDIVVVCGQPEFADDQRDTLTNPIVLLEVVSSSTEAYDRGFKSIQYRNLSSLEEYALVSQTEARIEVLRRQPTGDWLLSEWAGLHATCHFSSLDADISLSDIYQKIVFAAADPLSQRPSVTA